MNTNRTNYNNSLPAEYGTNSTQVKFKEVIMLQGESHTLFLRIWALKNDEKVTHLRVHAPIPGGTVRRGNRVTKMNERGYLKKDLYKNKPMFKSYANYYCDTNSDSSWGSDEDDQWEPDFKSEEENNSANKKRSLFDSS